MSADCSQRLKELLAEKDARIHELHVENHEMREKCYEFELQIKKLTKENRNMKFKLDQIRGLPEWPDIHVKIIKTEVEEDTAAAYPNTTVVPDFVLYTTKSELGDEDTSTVGCSSGTPPTSSGSMSTAHAEVVTNFADVRLTNRKKIVNAKPVLRCKRSTPFRKSPSVVTVREKRRVRKAKTSPPVPLRRSDRVKKSRTPAIQQPSAAQSRTAAPRPRLVRQSTATSSLSNVIVVDSNACPKRSTKSARRNSSSALTSPKISSHSQCKKCQATIKGTNIFYRYHVAEHEKIGIRCTVEGCDAVLDPHKTCLHYKSVHGKSIKNISLEQRNVYKAEIAKFKEQTGRLMSKYFTGIQLKIVQSKDLITCKQCGSGISKWAFHSHICSHLNLKAQCPMNSCREIVHQNYLLKHMKKIHFKAVPDLNKEQLENYEHEKRRITAIVTKVKKDYF
ncbi:hypothetical protein QR680_006966 [Steinernema hermaphroditum]|uniref:Uncharacterized protein n=1 Tax=Steinernema hermaphroditum TaxID=289476 RepID=A0AA39HZI7_9BILA|nr:hypothetical protein QR680_006966 [Steinernema hermaphroditum]